MQKTRGLFIFASYCHTLLALAFTISIKTRMWKNKHVEKLTTYLRTLTNRLKWRSRKVKMTNHYHLLVVFHFCRSANDIEEKRRNITPNKSYGPLNVASRTSASKNYTIPFVFSSILTWNMVKLDVPKEETSFTCGISLETGPLANRFEFRAVNSC